MHQSINTSHRTVASSGEDLQSTCVAAMSSLLAARHLHCESTRPSTVSVPLTLTGCNRFGEEPPMIRQCHRLEMTLDDESTVISQCHPRLLMLVHSAGEAREASPVKNTTNHVPTNCESEVSVHDHKTIVPHSSPVGPTTSFVRHVTGSNSSLEFRKFLLMDSVHYRRFNQPKLEEFFTVILLGTPQVSVSPSKTRWKYFSLEGQPKQPNSVITPSRKPSQS